MQDGGTSYVLGAVAAVVRAAAAARGGASTGCGSDDCSEGSDGEKGREPDEHV